MCDVTMKLLTGSRLTAPPAACIAVSRGHTVVCLQVSPDWTENYHKGHMASQNVCRQTDGQTVGQTDRAYPSHFVLRGGAGVDEGLGNDGQHGVDAVAHLDVQNELRVL